MESPYPDSGGGTKRSTEKNKDPQEYEPPNKKRKVIIEQSEGNIQEKEELISKDVVKPRLHRARPVRRRAIIKDASPFKDPQSLSPNEKGAFTPLSPSSNKENSYVAVSLSPNKDGISPNKNLQSPSPSSNKENSSVAVSLSPNKDSVSPNKNLQSPSPSPNKEGVSTPLSPSSNKENSSVAVISSPKSKEDSPINIPTIRRYKPDNINSFIFTPLDSPPHYPEYSICFPSISTTAYKFDLDIATTIACEEISNFLQKFQTPKIKLYLADIADSPTLEMFRKKSPSDPRFSIVVANLVSLTEKGIPCWFIVNASNPNFKGGGSGTNKAIHDACNDGKFFGGVPSLESLTKSLYKPPAKVGKAYPVDLVKGCPLFDKQQVHTVIHVVGPNMSPKRSNCLNGDYEKGSQLLRESYRSILNTFYQKAFGFLPQ